jgi:hypothetical protein
MAGYVGYGLTSHLKRMGVEQTCSLSQSIKKRGAVRLLVKMSAI